MKIYKETMKICFLSILIFTSSTIYSQGIPVYVPTTGLIGWWPFNGSANDLSQSLNHGNVFGAQLCPDRFSQPNSAYSFNGTNSYIQMLNSGPLNSNNRSISFWIKTNNSNIAQILGWGSQPPSGGEFNILINQICQGITIDIHNNYITYNAINLSDGNWHNVICTYNNNISNNITGVKFYIDSQNITSINCQNPITVLINTLNNPIVVGKYMPGATFFNGQIDDIGIWNRALTQQEITSLYQGCTGSVTASITPQGNTTFCAGNSVVLNATSGSGNTYQWSLNGNVINGATLSTISATQQGNYMVNIVAGGCTYPSNSINVNVNALPNVSINGLPNFINYFASPVQVIALPNGGISSGLGYSNGVFTPSIAGLGFKKIQYQYTDNNGCAGSASLSTIVYDTLCANPLGFIKSASNKIDLFPNPVQETITIKGNVPPHSSLEIFDTNGNLVFQELLSSENEQISIRQLKRALYHYRIINAGKILKSASIIKE